MKSRFSLGSSSPAVIVVYLILPSFCRLWSSSYDLSKQLVTPVYWVSYTSMWSVLFNTCSIGPTTTQYLISPHFPAYNTPVSPNCLVRSPINPSHSKSPSKSLPDQPMIKKIHTCEWDLPFDFHHYLIH
jgi:hypothetical protein